MKHGVEVHTLPYDVDDQQQASLRETQEECTWSSGAQYTFWLFLLHYATYLKSKLVEEIVDEVFDEADNVDVQVLPCDVMKDNPGSGRWQFVPQSEVFLMTVDGYLQC